MSEYRIRTMTRSELDGIIDWAAEEGWNPGTQDAECFYAADPEGFLIGTLDEAPVAAISAVRYGEDFGFLGLYLVKPEHRGKGYGLAIYQAGMDRLKGVTMGLDGVVEQQHNYRKSGFQAVCRNIRYEWKGKVAGRSDRLVDVRDLLPLVKALDRRFFPAERSAFLEAWLAQDGAVCLGLKEKDALTGYGVLRPCRKGYKVGPLFTEDADDADEILSGLLQAAESGEPVYFDVPNSNENAVQLAERHRMQPVFETARMYCGAPPWPKVEETFGITSFELG